MVSFFRSGIPLVGISFFVAVSLVDAAEVKQPTADDFWYSHSILAVQDGHSSEVIDVKGSKPETLNKKGEKRPIGSIGQFDFIRSDDFHEGNILVSGLQIERVSAVTVTDGGVKLNNMGDGYRGDYADLEFVADRDIKDCYLVLIITTIDYEKNSHGEMSYSLRFESLGALKAGKKKNASVLLGGYLIIDDIIPAVFSKGKEIHTNLSPKVAAHARTLMERKNQRRLTQYLEANSGRNQSAACIYYPYPHMQMERNEPPIDLPSDISVVFSLDALGHLSSIRFPPSFSVATQQKVVPLFNEWFFLPEIRNGKAVPSTVSTVVPLGSKMIRVGAEKPR